MIPHPTPSPSSKSKQSDETTTGLASATSKIQTTTTGLLSDSASMANRGVSRARGRSISTAPDKATGHGPATIRSQITTAFVSDSVTSKSPRNSSSTTSLPSSRNQSSTVLVSDTSIPDF